MAKRLTGIVVLLLGLTMILHVPFGNVLPALTITLLALTYLEEDGIAFLVAMLAALASLAITVATVGERSRRLIGSIQLALDKV